MSSPVPHRGMLFRHRRWLNADYRTPQLCRVTRVALGAVYYRPADGGSAYWIEVEDFDRVCLEVVAA